MSKITTIEKAIGQFTYRLQNGRYEPNQSDVEALTFIVDWINREKTREITDNVLFAKLFCRVFAQEVDYYKGDFKLAQKTMHEYLKQPIEFYYDKFIKDIDKTSLNVLSEQLGLSNKHPYSKTEIEKESDEKIISENQDKMLKAVSGHDTKGVYKSLNNTITEFINRYRVAK